MIKIGDATIKSLNGGKEFVNFYCCHGLPAVQSDRVKHAAGEVNYTVANIIVLFQR